MVRRIRKRKSQVGAATPTQSEAENVVQLSDYNIKKDSECLEMKEAAISYAEDGYEIVALKPGSKIPLQKGWQDKATSDIDEIEGLFKEYPNINIGLKTGGETRLLVVDFDTYEKSGMHGMDFYCQWELDFILRGHPIVETPSGGRHVYFEMPDGSLGCGVNVAPGVDIRAKGGYIVAPPSIVNGRTYKWIPYI